MNCWKSFPYECKNCELYRERIEYKRWSSLFLFSLFYHPKSYIEYPPVVKIEECKKYKKINITPLE